MMQLVKKAYDKLTIARVVMTCIPLLAQTYWSDQDLFGFRIVISLFPAMSKEWASVVLVAQLLLIGVILGMLGTFVAALIVVGLRKGHGK